MPLSRWVTPEPYPRRFDARFFAAALPDGATPTFEGGEVAAHAWLRPTDALAAMAAGELTLWLPDEHDPPAAGARRPPSTRFASAWRPDRSARSSRETVDDAIVRIVMPAGGGVAGQPVCAYLVGRRRFVLVDPGDPTGPGLDRALALAAERGGPIEAVALTHVDPDHAAGAEAVAERLGVPVLTGPGGGRPLPYDVREVDDLVPLEAGDVAVRPIHTPGPRPDHLAFVAGDGRFVLAGDLDGVRGARSVTAPPDEAAWAASRERLARLAPGATRLAGHPTPDTPG